MNSFFEDVMVPVVVVVLAICVFFGAILGLFHVYASYQCANYAHITGKETRFAAFDICYVKTEYGWQRWDEYKSRAIATEAAKELRK